MNFFKKHWITILIIVFFSIVIIIGFFEGIQETKQEQKSLSNNHKESDNNKEPKQPSRTKREIQPLQNQNPSPQTNTTLTPNSKIKITQEKFNKIASYIFSENEHEILPFNDLTLEEKNEIEKIKNSWKYSLSLLDKRQNKINEKQKECDNLINQRDSATNQIPPLQTQKQQKESELENKNKDIKSKQEELQKTTNKDDKKRLRDEIDKLVAERSQIIGEIVEIDRQIAVLESKQKMYTDMLRRAEEFKKDLEKDYDKMAFDDKNEISIELNSLYEII